MDRLERSPLKRDVDDVAGVIGEVFKKRQSAVGIESYGLRAIGDGGGFLRLRNPDDNALPTRTVPGQF